MKNFINIFSLILTLSLLMVGCQMDEPELDSLMSSAELQYEVTQNPDDPNMVILESLTPGAIPMWITPTGRSTKVKDTVRLPFSGTYNFIYNVSGGGGFVAGDTTTLNITTMNLSYVDDPLWNSLTGGVGESKTWILDNGQYGLATGPLAYADPGINQEWGDYQPNWEPAGSDVGATEEAYQGEMTFSLQGGAFITTTKPNEGNINESGTFFLDVKNHTLSTTDATILRLASFIPNADNWNSELNVLELNENQLRVAVYRTNDEGPWWYIMNYVSKEYAENYDPGDTPDPDPDIDLNGGSTGDLISVSSSKTWSLSPDTPFDWTDLEGNLLNGWASTDDYPDWAGYDIDDQAAVAQNKITFYADGNVETTTSDGVTAEGTYAVAEGTNLITFTDIIPSFAMGDWAVATTTEDNQWKIVKTQMTGSVVTDIWFGKRDPSKPEYMVFHFVLGSADFDPIEANRKLIIKSLTGPSGTRTFKVSDTWHVDWLAADLTGGWTSETTFADDFESNSWVWTAAVKAGLQDPTLTFTLDGGVVTCTKVQDGVTTSAEVVIDPENNTIDIDMDLIAFTDAANWLPTYGSTWYFCKTNLTEIESVGMWLGDLNDDETEVTAIHYVIAE